MGQPIQDGQIFHLKEGAAIGIPDHMHVCLKIGEQYLIFVVCTSQGDTVYNLVQSGREEPGTFIAVSSDSLNNFNKDITYVNCNAYWELSEDELNSLIQSGNIYTHGNRLCSSDLKHVIEGIILSPKIERKIKKKLISSHP